MGSSYAFILWPIANGEEITKGKVKELDRLGVEAVDAHTLKVTLKAPTPYFIGLLTHMHAYPVHRKNHRAARRQVDPGREPGLQRRPTAWPNGCPRATSAWSATSTTGTPPTCASTRWSSTPTEDKSTELRRFRSGELDATDDVPSDQIAWVEKKPRGAVPQHRVSRHLLLRPETSPRRRSATGRGFATRWP